MTISTVEDALSVLRADYSSLLEDLARGERVLWVGSGISRDQVPPVAELLSKVLSFLRDAIASSDPRDEHFLALREIIEQYLPEQLDEFLRSPGTWALPSDLSTLTNHYSAILATEVGTQDQDYLLWEALDIRETYGSPTLTPGPEHWLIAILVHEGVLDEAVTTNWDGLIERAVRDSTMPGAPEKLSVLVTAESFRSGRAPFKLYKAHGCAVLARTDPTYREYLVAQTFDIATWEHELKFIALVHKLRDLAKNRESLMLGTSVQDSNLLGQIARATQDLRWPWDPDHPACLFAEPHISQTQRDALRIYYRDDYPPHREDICSRSALGMYSGPVLGALAIHVTVEKLTIALGYEPNLAYSSDVLKGLQSGLAAIEHMLLTQANNHLDGVVTVLRSGLSALVQRYFDPANDLPTDAYRAIYDRPLKNGVDAAVRHLHIPELAVALGLLGVGAARGHWTLDIGLGDPREQGVLRLERTSSATGGASQVVITRDWVETNALKSTDYWTSNSGSIVVIQATGEPHRVSSRGLNGGLGSGRRRAGPSRRTTLLAELHGHADSIDTLVDRFRATVAA